MSIQQYQTTKQGGPFALVTAPKPKPGPNEVSIRPKAVALNAIDWKNLKFGAIVRSWPAVLGIEGAGIVDSVGEDVTAFKTGDEVMSFGHGIVGNGTFREIYTVPENFVVKKPGILNFEEATSLPICYLTAAATIRVGLKIPLPGLSKISISNSIQSALVLGGSSAVGAAAIQLLRLALPHVFIITTSSVAHHAHLQSLGASKCLERGAQDDSTVLKASTPYGTGVDVIIDAVAAGASSPAVYQAFRVDGPKLYSLVITGPPPKFPEGIQGVLVGGQDMLDAEPDAMPYLGKLVVEGKYKLPLKIEVVGKGWDAIDAGLKRYPAGYSGTKLVVTL